MQSQVTCNRVPGFRRRFRQALVQSQVRFNTVPEKVPEKVWEAPDQVQQGSGEGSGEAPRKPWCKAKSGSTGPGEACRDGGGEGFGNFWCRARSGSNRFQGFPALGFAARFRKVCKNKTLRLLGIPTKLIQNSSVYASQEEKGQIITPGISKQLYVGLHLSVCQLKRWYVWGGSSVCHFICASSDSKRSKHA